MLVSFWSASANRGVTDPGRIAADALAYNQRGIYLSTIGLGLEFNDALLSHLAHQGQGGYGFVDLAQEMDRVFREHVAGLKQRAAGEISLGMQEIDRMFQAGRYEAAWRLAVDLENRLNEVVCLTHGTQLQADAELMQRYQQTLAEALWQTEGRRPRQKDGTPPESPEARPDRGKSDDRPTPTPAWPTVEIR